MSPSYQSTPFLEKVGGWKRLSALFGLIFMGTTCLPVFSWGEVMDRPLKQILRLKDPLVIHADRLEFQRKAHKTIYSGHVVARQEDYRLYCQRLEIHWDPQIKKISRLIARGRVKLETDEGVATSEIALLNLASRTIVLTGSPRLTSGDEFVEGERIIYSIDQKKSTVLGGRRKRVKSRLSPGGRGPRLEGRTP